MRPTERNKPVNFLQPLRDFKIAKDVASLPSVFVRNSETSGICRGRLSDLQNWVIEDFKKKYFEK